MGSQVNDWKIYLAFGIAGIIIGLLFPPVASFFVLWKAGMLPWFVLICVIAGEMMAMTAAVVVRLTIVKNLRAKEQAERDKREALEGALQSYSRFADEIAQGRLTARLGSSAATHGDDGITALGRQLDAMADSLHSLSSQTHDATTNLTAASSGLLAASAQQAQGATQQAAAVAEITTTVEEVRQTAEQAAERAQAVIGTTEAAQNAYEEGLAAVETTVESMTELRDRVQSIAENILSLSEKNQRIGEIVGSVSELAEQSNLLAINASIEAAKAGEQGRGFAVVASEVRNLAEQSKQATRQVRGIVAEIQRATNAAVMVTEEGAKQAESGVKLGKTTGETLRELAKIIDEAIQSARQIAALSRQQALGIDQVSEAMRSIRAASKDTEAATRSTEQSARALASLAEVMNQQVARFVL